MSVKINNVVCGVCENSQLLYILKSGAMVFALLQHTAAALSHANNRGDMKALKGTK